MRVLAAAAPWAAITVLLLVTGCGADAPVLSGVPAPVPVATPTDAPTEGEATAAPSGGTSATGTYQKPDGVYIDARHFGGKRYHEVRDEIADQLGALLGAQDLEGDNGRELRFEKGTLRLVDDQIILVDVTLPTPLRRTEALAALGFPPATGQYLTLHREFRLNHVWDFRRLRMMRENRHSENVLSIQAWFRVPGDHDGEH